MAAVFLELNLRMFWNYRDYLKISASSYQFDEDGFLDQKANANLVACSRLFSSAIVNNTSSTFGRANAAEQKQKFEEAQTQIPDVMRGIMATNMWDNFLNDTATLHF